MVSHCFIREDPVIRRDEILTARMLESMAMLPNALQELAHGNYGDGFVSGLGFEERDGSIWLQPGIVKHKNIFFLLRRPFDLGAMVEEHRKVAVTGRNFRILLLDKFDERNVDGVLHTSPPLVIEPAESSQRGLTIGVFSDQSALRLPSPDASDFANEYTQTARLNILETPWACRDSQSTFHPLIFQGIAARLARKEIRTSLDDALMFAIYDRGHVSMPALRHYIISQGGRWPGDERREIFKALCPCLDYAPEVRVGWREPIQKAGVKKKEPPTILTRED